MELFIEILGYVGAFLAGSGLTYFVAPKAQRGISGRQHRAKTYEEFVGHVDSALRVLGSNGYVVTDDSLRETFFPSIGAFGVSLAKVKAVGCSRKDFTALSDALTEYAQWGVDMFGEQKYEKEDVQRCIATLVDALAVTANLLKRV